MVHLQHKVKHVRGHRGVQCPYYSCFFWSCFYLFFLLLFCFLFFWLFMFFFLALLLCCFFWFNVSISTIQGETIVDLIQDAVPCTREVTTPEPQSNRPGVWNSPHTQNSSSRDAAKLLFSPSNSVSANCACSHDCLRGHPVGFWLCCYHCHGWKPTLCQWRARRGPLPTTSCQPNPRPPVKSSALDLAAPRVHIQPPVHNWHRTCLKTSQWKSSNQTIARRKT